MKSIPEDTGSFLKIRNLDLLYVDKTAYIHRLVTSSGRSCCFLARPRRFGKSLLITTLKELFSGRRDLFRGLAIADTDYDFKRYPVLHFDFGFVACRTGYEDFRSSLISYVRSVLVATGYQYDEGATPGINFGAAIDYLAAANPGSPPVILIDEYDDPVAKVIDSPDVAEKVRDEMSQFYGQLKGRTDKIRFLMITGVSRFTKLSIFSTLSNLVDISFDDNYAAMLGYTEAELESYFADRMQLQAEVMNLPMSAYRLELKRLYNGYRFWKQRGENVYNPVSININFAFSGNEFKHYWTSTGKASTLMNLLKRDDLLSFEPENVTGVTEEDLDVSDLHNLRPVPMLYQEGYLTIDEYNYGMLTLRVPNKDTRDYINEILQPFERNTRRFLEGDAVNLKELGVHELC